MFCTSTWFCWFICLPPTTLALIPCATLLFQHPLLFFISHSRVPKANEADWISLSSICLSAGLRKGSAACSQSGKLLLLLCAWSCRRPSPTRRLSRSHQHTQRPKYCDYCLARKFLWVGVMRGDSVGNPSWSGLHFSFQNERINAGSCGNAVSSKNIGPSMKGFVFFKSQRFKSCYNAIPSWKAYLERCFDSFMLVREILSHGNHSRLPKC